MNMRQPLLYQQNLARKLKQLLLLFSLLLLPSAAWGQTINTVFTGYDSDKNSFLYDNESTGKWSITTDYTGEYSPISYGNSTNPVGFSISVENSNTLNFDFKSDFQLEGTVNSGTKIATVEFDKKTADNVHISVKKGSTTIEQRMYVTSPLEIELSNNVSFSGEKIDIRFEASNNASDLSMVIKSIKIYNLQTTPSITVAGNSPDTDGNISGNGISGTVTFDALNSTLTLDNATIEGGIEWMDNLAKTLTIKVKGVSSVIGNNTTPPFKAEYECSLKVERLNNTDAATLKYVGTPDNCGLEPTPDTFHEFSNTYNDDTYNYYTTEDVYGLTIGGNTVHNISGEPGYKDDIMKDETSTPTVTFDAQNSTLTLSDGASVGQISYSGTSNLTIAFGGTCSITTEETYAIRYEGSVDERPKLTFSLTNETGSLNISGDDSAIKGFSDVDFGNLNLASTISQGVYYDKTDNLMRGLDTNPSDLTITTETYYPIWIYDPSISSTGYSHTQLTGESTITIGEGTVSFDGNHTITMSNINFNYDGNTIIVVGPSMTKLIVNLVGTSSAGSESIVLSLWDTTPLTFTTNEGTPGSLTGYNIVSWKNANGQISCENGLVYNAEDNPQTISTTGTRIKIGDTPIKTNDDITIQGVSFDATSNTLTLTEATIEDASIQVYVDDFTVEISGTNTISGEITYAGSNYQSSTIQISNTDEASLTLGGIGISGFGDCSWSEGLYLSAENGDGVPTEIHYEPYEEESGYMTSYYGEFSTVTFSTTKPSESIWIGDTPVGDNGRFEGIENVEFDKDSNTLTLNKATISADIISSLPNLTIKLTEGQSLLNNTSTNGGQTTVNHYIISSNPSATLTFTTDGIGYFSSSLGNGGIPWKGFAGNPTFENKLVFTQAAGTEFIKVLSPPRMSYDSEGLTFSGLSDGYNYVFDCYYSITYEDDNENNVQETKYNPGESPNDPLEPVSMEAKPCTVTAYLTYKDCFGNTTESDIATGKYFGFAEKMKLVTLPSDAGEKELVLPEILPAVGEGDGITFVYESDDVNIIYKNADSKWMIKDYGGTWVSAFITGTTPFTVLNEAAELYVNVLHDPTFEAYYGDDETNVYNGKGTGNVSVEISCSDLSQPDMDDYKLMCYPGTDKTKAVDYDEALNLVSTTTVNAFIRYTNPDTEEYFDSEPVSNTYTVIQQLDIPSFEGSMVFQTYYSSRYSLQIPNGLKAYIITDKSEDKHSVVATAIEYIPKGKAILLEKNGDMPEGGYVAETYTGEEGDFSGNMLFYVDDNFTSINTSGNEYVLYNNEFIKATGTIAQGKCYLGLNGEVTSGIQPHSRGFSIDTNGGGTSGINEVISEGVNSEKWADGECYDLQGRRIQKPTKAGLYIVNGKKMVINNK